MAELDYAFCMIIAFICVQMLQELLPVIFVIHGGGLVIGNALAFQTPDYLLDRDVILVSAQYRLNIFGFFNLGIEDSAGNQALWDQQLGKHNFIDALIHY